MVDEMREARVNDFIEFVEVGQETSIPESDPFIQLCVHVSITWCDSRSIWFSFAIIRELLNLSLSLSYSVDVAVAVCQMLSSLPASHIILPWDWVVVRWALLFDCLFGKIIELDYHFR